MVSLLLLLQTQGFAGAAAAFSKPLAEPDLVASLSSLLKGPPQGGTNAFEAAMRQVLTETTQLDDVKKVIAEFWANGPDGTTPPGRQGLGGAGVGALIGVAFRVRVWPPRYVPYTTLCWSSMALMPEECKMRDFSWRCVALVARAS
jgi:hypothetical protein